MLCFSTYLRNKRSQSRDKMEKIHNSTRTYRIDERERGSERGIERVCIYVHHSTEVNLSEWKCESTNNLFLLLDIDYVRNAANIHANNIWTK